jgi:hypothetical protein
MYKTLYTDTDSDGEYSMILYEPTGGHRALYINGNIIFKDY